MAVDSVQKRSAVASLNRVGSLGVYPSGSPDELYRGSLAWSYVNEITANPIVGGKWVAGDVKQFGFKSGDVKSYGFVSGDSE